MAPTPETVEVRSREEWREWLAANHRRAESILLVMYRKDFGDRYVSYDAIVEDALCFGWIDSTRRRLDNERTTLLLSPRRANSGWSNVNKVRVERLIAAGRMAPAGLSVIERAKANGTWTRFDAAEALEIPDDLALALGSLPEATANFASFPPSARRVILQWLFDAKRPETRSRRIEEIVTKAARGERAR